MKLVHKFSGDPVTHTQAWSQSLHPFLNLCVLWQWLGVQTGQKYLPVCVGAKPITYGPGPMSPPHLTLMFVRKYVSTPHQRRGVVVVVNEKALV